MRKIDDFILWTAFRADVLQGIGLVFILIAVLYDPLRLGLRGFREYAVEWKGIGVILSGVILIMISKRAEGYLKK